MRLYTLLILIAVVTAFSAGYLALSMTDAKLSAQESNSEIQRIKSQFLETQPSLGEIDLKNLYPIGSTAQFLDPRSLFVQSDTYSYDQIRSLVELQETCVDTQVRFQTDDMSLQKALLWIRFKCKMTDTLPPTFFDHAPFIFPLGGSYAFLGFSERERLRLNAKWLVDHLRYMNASEFAYLGDFRSLLEPPYQILATMPAETLRGIGNSEEWILSEKYVLYQKRESALASAQYNGPSREAHLYRLYSRDKWDEHLSNSSFITEPATVNDLCLLKDGHICWKTNPEKYFQKIRGPTQILFGCSVILVLICVGFMIVKIRQQKFDEERRRFALQALTHELRTPLASLVLSSEEFMDHYDSIPTLAQNIFLRMSDDIRRLQRLAEQSRQYLNSERGKKDRGIVVLSSKKIPSVNDYMMDVLAPFKDQIEVALVDSDREFALDPYWFSVCVKNLVENALFHGKKPVGVNVSFEGETLVLAVWDRGQWSRVGAPLPGSPSQGLGLGLEIVKRVAATMKAELTFTGDPTTVTLRLPEQI